MRTAASSSEARRTLEDLAALLAFRRASLRGASRRRMAVVLAVLVVVTAAAAVIPAFVPGAGEPGEMRDLLPLAYAGFLLLTAGSAIASGGGRELIPREQAVPFPISSATDHLGALLLAPLNTAWLLQGWALLGSTAYVVGPGALAPAIPVALLWMALNTALGQLVGWFMEALRRGPAGTLVSRTVLGVAGAVGALLAWTGVLRELVDASPVHELVDVLRHPDARWVLVMALLLLACLAAVLAGLWPARIASVRAPRDEQKLESGSHPARRVVTGPEDRSGDLRLLLRTDRASVWRSVPLRRGLMVLAVLPGAGAVGAQLEWDTVAILPGLTAAGVTLLYGVNAWSLDGRGALWRASLPVAPSLEFTSRCVVLAELVLLCCASLFALALLPAGSPTTYEASAVLAATVVATLQVVSVSMVWSARSPHAVNLRSARATPAPPVVMVGYSLKLSLTTALTGVVFSGLAQISWWPLSVVFALPFVAWSTVRLRRARRAWGDPVRRAHVVTTVAA